jgi:3-oxoacyl-[acyl-carrier protein] reductase
VTFPGYKGKVAVVTGGSRGVGAAACRLLAGSGARVAAVARGAGELQELVDELRWIGTDSIGVVADCTDPLSIAQARDCVYKELGPPEVLFTFAGTRTALHPTGVLGVTPQAWHQVVDAELTATFLTVQAFLPAMLALGSGSIVTMGATLEPSRHGSAAFLSAKAGIEMFSRQVATEVAGSGVRVNCLARGFDRAAPDDVAFAALYLASDAASCVNAATLAVAGGIQ